MTKLLVDGFSTKITCACQEVRILVYSSSIDLSSRTLRFPTGRLVARRAKIGTRWRRLAVGAVAPAAAGWINQSFFQGRTSLNEKALRSRYLEITQRRNEIAHDADLIDGDLQQRRPIDEADVNDAIDWIERIALAIAHVIDGETGQVAGEVVQGSAS
jgi:hypothetical protein